MELNRTDKGNVTVLELGGKLMGGPDATILHETLHELVDSNVKSVILDLSNVNWINSSGLGILISGLTTVRNSGGQMHLANATERITNLLEITKLSSVFQTFESVEDAIAGLK